LVHGVGLDFASSRFSSSGAQAYDGPACAKGHGWIKVRAHPHDRDRTVAIASQDPP
jgi:hypothetical protein